MFPNLPVSAGASGVSDGEKADVAGASRSDAPGPAPSAGQPYAGALPDEAGPVLLAHVRAAVAQGLIDLGAAPATAADAGSPAADTQAPAAAPTWPDWAGAKLGTFVTLTQLSPTGHHDLRGCIGTLSDHRPISDSVPANALNAAFRDPRFPHLRPEELATTRFEVSVLSPAEPISVSSEAEAIAALRPGVDGVILSDGYHHATFLPQVWEDIPDPEVFLQQLRIKAGLRPNHWGPGTKLQRYRVQSWTE